MKNVWSLIATIKWTKQTIGNNQKYMSCWIEWNDSNLWLCLCCTSDKCMQLFEGSKAPSHQHEIEPLQYSLKGVIILDASSSSARFPPHVIFFHCICDKLSNTLRSVASIVIIIVIVSLLCFLFSFQETSNFNVVLFLQSYRFGRISAGNTTGTYYAYC